MKRGNFKAVLGAVIIAFTFMLAGVQSGQAQTGMGDGIYTVPSGNYVSAAEANVLLTDQETMLINYLQTLTPGSQQYKATLRAVMYYRNILQAVMEGKQIPESIVAGLSTFTTTQYGQYSKTEKVGLKQDAIEMLSN